MTEDRVFTLDSSVGRAPHHCLIGSEPGEHLFPTSFSEIHLFPISLPRPHILEDGPIRRSRRIAGLPATLSPPATSEPPPPRDMDRPPPDDMDRDHPARDQDAHLTDTRELVGAMQFIMSNRKTLLNDQNYGRWRKEMELRLKGMCL